MMTNTEFDAKELSTSELVGMLQSQSRNPLAVKINGRSSKAKSKKQPLKADEENMARALCQPVQRVDLQYSIGDRQYLEASLTWSDIDEPIAFLARREKKWGLSQRSPEDIIASLSQVMGLSAPLKTLLIGGRFSSLAGLVCLSLADAYRRENYLSALEFRPPSSSFTLDEIAVWLSPTKGWDPRWMSLFLAKILPMDEVPLENEAVKAALNELTEAGLLVKIEAEENEADLYSLTVVGDRFCEGLMSHASKVAIRHGRLLEDDRAGYEILMWVRDADALWFLDIGAHEAMLTTLDHQAAAGILEQVFKAPQLKSKQAHTMQLDDQEPSTILLGDRSQGAAFCPECGSPVKEQNRFCTNCGANISSDSGGE